MVFCIMLILPVNISLIFLNGENTKEEEGQEQALNSDLEWQVLHELAAVIPVEYEAETLKAQAVILRTNILADTEENRERKSYPLLFSYREEWGEQYEENCGKLFDVVTETKGMYLEKEKVLVRAAYFRLSNGHTRSGAECFGGRFPEFSAKKCGSDLLSEEFLQKKEFGKNEFTAKLNKITGTTHSFEEWKACEPVCKYDSAGYVLSLNMGETSVGGEVFRQTFGLPSSDFTLTFEEGGVKLVTRGVGIGIGFSQYGANELAKEGQDFIQLLNFFFTNIAISKTE